MEQSKIRNEIEVEPVKLLGVLLRKSWLIGLCGLVCGAAVFMVSFFLVAPQYASSVMFYINNDTSGVNITTSDISASKRLADSCVAILNTRSTMDRVISHAGVGRSYKELLEMVDAYGLEDTVLLEVVVTSTDPREAFVIADAISSILPERIDGAFTGVAATVVDTPVLATEPSGPEHFKLTVIAFFAGVTVSGAGVVILQIVEETKKK